MKIDSKFRYIYILELSPAEYRLLCNGMLDSEVVTPPEALDYKAIVRMRKQLGEKRGKRENALSKDGKISCTS